MPPFISLGALVPIDPPVAYLEEAEAVQIWRCVRMCIGALQGGQARLDVGEGGAGMPGLGRGVRGREGPG